MGSLKPILEVGGESLLRHAVKVAETSGADQVVVVLGHARERLERQLGGCRATVVVNPDYALGQSTSLRKGLDAVSAECEGVVVFPADQPFLEAEHLRELVAVAGTSQKPVVASEAGGIRGAPVFYHRRMFPQLNALTGDVGGRDLIRAHPEWVEVVCFDDARIMWDIDTPEDYRRAVAEHERSSAPPP